ncbi:unnamed protein product [Cunninghamella echinulata]
MNSSIPKVSSDATLQDTGKSKRRFSFHSNHSNDHLDPDFHLQLPCTSHHDIEKGQFFPSPSPCHSPPPPSSESNYHRYHHVQNPIRGNAGVLALLSFSVVTFLLGSYNLFFPTTPKNVILPSAVLFGGCAQFISGFLCIINGITFSGILFVSYGSFWFGQGLMMIPSIHGALTVLTEDEVAKGDAIYHFIWAFYTLFHVAISLKIKNGTFMSTWNLVFVFITLFLQGIANVTGVIVLIRISGVTAYFAALGAMYTAYGELMEEQDEHCWMGAYKKHKK